MEGGKEGRKGGRGHSREKGGKGWLEHGKEEPRS